MFLPAYVIKVCQFVVSFALLLLKPYESVNNSNMELEGT